MDKPDYIIHKKGCGRIFPLYGICTCGAYDPVDLEKEEVIPATCERCGEREVYISKKFSATLCSSCILDNMIKLGAFAYKYASPECECNPVHGIHAAFCPRDGI